MVYTLEDYLTSIQEYLSFLGVDLWQEIVNDEIYSLEFNKT